MIFVRSSTFNIMKYSFLFLVDPAKVDIILLIQKQKQIQILIHNLGKN